MRGAKDFSAVMSRTFIGPSIFIQSDFHSASGSEGTSFNQSDPIMEPTIETTLSVHHQVKSMYMETKCTEIGLKMPTEFTLWKRIQVYSSVQVSDYSLISCDCRSVRLWLQNEVVLHVVVHRCSSLRGVDMMSQCSLTFAAYGM